MKKLLFFIYTINIYSYCFSQSSTLSIVSENDPFILYLNSINVIPLPNTAAVVDGLKVGANHIRMVFAKKGIPELNAQIELQSDGKLHQLSYKVVKDSKGKLILQLVNDNSMSMLGQNGEDAEPQISSNDIKGDLSSTNTNNASSGVSISGGSQKSGVSVTINHNTNFGNNKTEATYGDKRGVNDQKYKSSVPAVSDGRMCSSPTVDTQTLLKFKYKLSSINMEMYKAKDIIDFMNKQCMLSAQVSDLVRLIQMNDYQYDVAQLGYLRTYDQSKYGIVVDALMADFNKDKLLNFIYTNQEVETSEKNHKKFKIIDVAEHSIIQPTQNSNYESDIDRFNNSCIPMQSNDFDEALQAVDDPIDENNKLEVAKAVFDKECLSTNQVYRVVDLFIDENRKLDFAKFAYSRTSDKEKYFRINKAFIDERRITELSNFVKNNR